jgi:hypothetical protein
MGCSSAAVLALQLRNQEGESEEGPMKEKRSHKRRTKPGETVIRFEVQEEFKAGNSGRTGVVTDIGPNGVGLFTEEKLELGQIIKFPDGHYRSEFAEMGQVIWTAESHDGFRVGIKFF